MQLNDLKPKIKIKEKKRVGRGGRRGTYSGRGQKGQKARAGRRIRPQLRDIIKKLPKKRGYRFKPIVKEQSVVLNFDVLGKKFKDGGEINPKTLLKKGLVSRGLGRVPRIKILSRGEVTGKFNVSGCFVSASAKAKIEKAGGKIE